MTQKLGWFDPLGEKLWIHLGKAVKQDGWEMNTNAPRASWK